MASNQPETVDVEFYVLAEPVWHDWLKDAQGRPLLRSAKVVKATQGKPTVPREGVATKLTLRFPASAFLPLQPEAVVVIQPGDAETITVEATDPRGDQTP